MGEALFIFSIFFFMILYMVSKGKYDEYLDPLSKKDYILKDIMSIGFWIMDKVGYKYNTLYDKKLRLKTLEFKGTRDADYYLYVHWAYKSTALVISFVLLCLIGAGWAIGEEEGSLGAEFLVILIAVLVIIFFALDQELIKKIEKRKLSIQKDFPDFINKLTLLLNAGMPVSSAWARIIEENRNPTPFYYEAEIAIREIQNGKAPSLAYEDFARNCRIPEITKFVAIVIQNFKKGNSEMIPTLQGMSKECWELRKHVARRLGEEASTKILFPMIFNFLVVVIIVAMPAVMAMRV